MHIDDIRSFGSFLAKTASLMPVLPPEESAEGMSPDGVPAAVPEEMPEDIAAPPAEPVPSDPMDLREKLNSIEREIAELDFRRKELILEKDRMKQELDAVTEQQKAVEAPPETVPAAEGVAPGKQASERFAKAVFSVLRKAEKNEGLHAYLSQMGAGMVP
jgi:hypothetical protein